MAKVGLRIYASILFILVHLNLLKGYSLKSVCQLGYVVRILRTVTRPAYGNEEQRLVKALTLHMPRRLACGNSESSASGRVVVGPVARCRSGPPAALAGPQQTHASRAGPGGGGGGVHSLSAPAGP